MCDRDSRTCFDCRNAEIDPGTPDVNYLPNGDPGYPGDPAVAMCLDPLAAEQEYEFEEILVEVDRAVRNAVWKNTAEYKNCEPGEEMRLPFERKQSIQYALGYHGDFARFCPMFVERTRICACCKQEYPANQGEFYCPKCEEGIKQWEKEHEEELSKEIGCEPRSDNEVDRLFKQYEDCCALDLQPGQED